MSRARAVLAVVGSLLTFAGLGPTALAATPAGFVDEVVATSIPAPTAFAFLPDGRMLVTTQGGTIRLVQEGAATTIALDLTAKVCSNSERGVLGIALDPQFSATSNRFVYVYYTFKRAGVCETNTPNAPVNRVSRFTVLGTATIDAGSESVLVDNIPSPNGNHNGGDVQFGKDGYLYVGIGDGGANGATARQTNILLGKILRITRQGGIPPDNPFTGTGTAPCAATGQIASGTCQEIYALGLRNPFRLAFDPNAIGTRFYVNDVGAATWEEIDLGQAGADYGWNVREGDCALGSTTNCGPPPAGMTNPIYDYPHTSGCRSITGGAFVPFTAWPAPYAGSYLFADYICGTIFRLDPDGAGSYVRTPFVTGLGIGPVHMAFGPWGSKQALYYATYAGRGQIRRVSYIAPEHRYRTPGSASCGTPSPQFSVRAPTMFGGNPAAPEYVIWRTHFWRYTGSGWEITSSRYLVSAATPTARAEYWYDASTGEYVGTTSEVSQTHQTVPPGGLWLATQELAWFSTDAQLVASDHLLVSATDGSSSLGGLCYWP